MIATEFKTRDGWHRDRPAPSPPVPQATAQRQSKEGLPRRLRDFSAAHPAVWIAGAVTLGVILGCIVKRR